MEEVWIIGAGHFGWLAFQRLSKCGKKRHFVLVDPVKENLLRCKGPNITLEQADGVDFLEQNLLALNGPDWIIPALPLHLMAEWLLVRMGPARLQRVTLPSEVESLLPNPIRGPDGNLYVSHADFRCPDNCAEPSDICTVTKKPRDQDMFKILRDIKPLPFQPLVIRSCQLGPGIGGYRPRHLFALLDKVEQARGHLLLSTACRCHGVLTGLKRL